MGNSFADLQGKSGNLYIQYTHRGGKPGLAFFLEGQADVSVKFDHTQLARLKEIALSIEDGGRTKELILTPLSDGTIKMRYLRLKNPCSNELGEVDKLTSTEEVGVFLGSITKASLQHKTRDELLAVQPAVAATSR